MQVTVPTFLPEPWANQGQSATIPDTTTKTGRASWAQGFPTVTSLPLAAGGIPPNYLDFQGVLQALSSHVFFQQSGSLYTWSASLNYLIGAHVLGSNGYEYVAIAASGPDTSAGAQDPTTASSYWKSGLDVMEGASSSSPGSAGIVPAPEAGDQNLPLRGDGTWATSLDCNITGNAATATTATNAPGYLPVSGGTMSGAIRFPVGVIYGDPENGLLRIDSVVGSDTYGPRIYLFNSTSSNNANTFILRNMTSPSEYIDLLVSASGQFVFGGKKVELVAQTGSGYIRYASSLQICWGNVTVSGGQATVSYPVAFSTYPYTFATYSAGSPSTNNIGTVSTTTNLVISSANWEVNWLAIGTWS